MAHARSASVGEYIPLRVNQLATAYTPVGIALSTTATTAITGGGALTVVTPAAMTNIAVGVRLNIAGGTGTAENVTVMAVTSTTFSAFFQNAHSGTYNITSVNGTLLGSIVVNTPGSANAVLTLYNGSPNTAGPQPAGTAFALLTNPSVAGVYIYQCEIRKGLFYTLTGTTSPELTFTYLDALQQVY